MATEGRRPAASRRAAIYARFSTELQRDQSIEDQIALCRAAAHRDGFSVIATYEDRARSGASMFGRPGLEQLLRAAEGREFDVLFVEALDRLSRDMADLAGIHRQLTFLSIEIRAVHDGVADTVTVGLRGLVGQLFREDGVKKIRRGMAGVIREGRYAGGRSYGYRPTPGEPGRPQIVAEEAAIVRRIFLEYADGRSPRDIAHDLNREGVPPPRGAAWNASTINGNGERGNGVLQNPLYVGELVWNRVQMVKDPSTGRRISRPNPPAEWQRADAPQLAIVDRETWERAAERKRASLARGARAARAAAIPALASVGPTTLRRLRVRHGEARQRQRPPAHPLQSGDRERQLREPSILLSRPDRGRRRRIPASGDRPARADRRIRASLP
jgi:DNA invertase Pin-like site-specific DNA recombinase